MGYLINYKKQKYIYIHIPKTGGTTIEHIFDEYINSSNSTKTLTGHLSLKDTKKRYDLNNCITFSTVRNPWDWYVSHYFYLKQKHIGDTDFKDEYNIINDEKNDFNDFIKYVYENRDILVYNNGGDNTLKYQEMLDWSYDGQKHVDHFIKIEELSMKSLNSIGLDIHYTHTKLNTSDHNHYTKYYDKVTKNIVKKMHKNDIKFFNYKFGE